MMCPPQRGDKGPTTAAGQRSFSVDGRQLPELLELKDRGSGSGSQCMYVWDMGDAACAHGYIAGAGLAFGKSGYRSCAAR